MKRRFYVLLAMTLPSLSSAQQPEIKQPIEFRGHTGSITSLVFVGERVLASASSDKSIRLWDVAHEKRSESLNGHEQSVEALAVTGDGLTLASADTGGIVKLWDVSARKERKTLPRFKGGIDALRFSPKGKVLAIGGGGYDKAAEKPWSELKLWDVEKGEQIAELEGHPTAVKSIAFSPDGNTIASCGTNGTTILWQTIAPYKKTVLGENPKGASSVAFSPDGKIVSCGSYTESTLVKFWTVATGEELPTIEDRFGPFIISLAYLPGGKTLVMGGMRQRAILDEDRGSYLALWDTATLKERLVIRGHFRPILCIAVSADGSQLATGGLDKEVRLWDLKGLEK